MINIFKLFFGGGNSAVRQEFQDRLQKIHNIAANPALTREQKRKGLRDNLDKLSEIAYQTYFKDIMEIIQKKKENCAEYKNSEEQVNNIIQWLPRLQDHRELVLKIIRERRKKYGLVV